MRKSYGAVLGLAIGTLGYFLVGNFEVGLLGNFESSGLDGPLRAILGLALTIVGAILGAAYRALVELKASGVGRIENFRQLLSDIFRSVDLWISLAVSPMVFALLLSSTDGVATPGFILIALQNGFFCQAIVERMRQQVTAEG
ncbi:MAG: hypothetical protein N4A70_00050 [Pelagimonas sp.]|jgi:hypothetical protein|nr:hypothetical protein [Pelagimonas sp.]